MINRNDLTASQLSSLMQLQITCHEHDGITLCFPIEETASHYLFHMEDEKLVSAFSLYFSDEETCECIAMTLPDFRQQGYFSVLLEEVCEWLEEQEAEADIDLCFLTDHHCTATDIVLEHLEAELWFDEYMMEILLSPAQSASAKPATDNSGTNIASHKLSILPDPETADHYTIVHNHAHIGTFYLHISKSRGYFYGFEIQESLRGQGYGTAAMKTVMSWISSQPELFTDQERDFALSLQVSSENVAAFHLYKKTGFHVTETLSYYLY